MDIMDLFRRYKDDVYRLAVNYTHNPQEAEDICQTVFMKLLEQEELTPGKEKAWLMQVTANQCRDLLRSGWWKRTVALDDSLPAQHTEADETIHALSCLQPKYRVVLYLYYYEGYTTPEIAALLHASISTVTTRLSRGRDRLKKLLEEG